MISPDELNSILDRIAKGQPPTEADIAVLRQLLSGDGQNVSQIGKYAVNLRQGQDIQIGDTFGGLRQRIYQGVDAEAIRQIFRSIITELQAPTQIPLPLGILDAQVLKVSPKGKEKAKTAMKSKGLSEDQLAKEVNVSRSTILRFFNQESIAHSFKVLSDDAGTAIRPIEQN